MEPASESGCTWAFPRWVSHNSGTRDPNGQGFSFLVNTRRSRLEFQMRAPGVVRRSPGKQPGAAGSVATSGAAALRLFG